MKLVDAHIHLSDEEYSTCIEEVVQEAKDANVVAMVSNSMDLETSIRSLQLAKKFPRTVYAAVGIHPWVIKRLSEDELQQTLELMKKESQNKSFVAIGEIGLDSKYMDVWEKQLRIFDVMLHVAEQLDLPAIIHSRGTTAQIIDMLPSYNLKKVLLHWFSQPTSLLPMVVDRGYYISEGVPTVYSDGIRDVVKNVPITHLLTETDGPVQFFKPPFKGKRTTSAFIPIIVDAISELQKLEPDDVAEQVAKNFQDLFEVDFGS